MTIYDICFFPLGVLGHFSLTTQRRQLCTFVTSFSSDVMVSQNRRQTRMQTLRREHPQWHTVRLFPGRRHLPSKSQLQFLEKTAEQVRKMHGRASVWCGEAGSTGSRQDLPSLEKKKTHTQNRVNYWQTQFQVSTYSPQSAFYSMTAFTCRA